MNRFIPIGFAFIFFLGLSGLPSRTRAGESPDVYTIDQFVGEVARANIGLKSAKNRIGERAALKNAHQSDLYPVFFSTYEYEKEEETTKIGSRVTDPEDEHTFSISFRQPVFAGFSILNTYRIAEIRLDIAKLDEKRLRGALVLDAKTAYYQFLKAEKRLAVAEETVVQIAAHEAKAEKFHQVGKTPLHDLLQARVELANARQALIVARNGMDIAKARINNLLRRPLDEEIRIADEPKRDLFERDVRRCIDAAEKNRPELKIADLEILAAQKETDIAKKEYYPSVDLTGYYYKQGTDLTVSGGDGITNSDGWNLTATARWKIWDWGKRKNGVAEKRSGLTRAKDWKTELIETIRYEVRKAWLNAMESEKNIAAVEAAIEQAELNFKIKQERYNQQLATSTDVLDARALLSRTKANYYDALYDLKMALGSLDWAMGI